MYYDMHVNYNYEQGMLEYYAYYIIHLKSNIHIKISVTIFVALY